MADKYGAELLKRYEALLATQDNFYFDADDFDEIAFQYELSEQFQKALDAVERGLSLHPGNASLLLRRGRYLLALERVEEAEAQLNELPLDSEEALLLQIELCFMQGNPEAAFAAVDILLQDVDLSLDGCYDVIDLYLDFEHIGELPRFVERAAERFSDASDLWRELAVVYEEKEELDKAVAIYNRLLDKNPYSFTDWFNIAKLYALKKAYRDAVDACDFALAVKEDDEGALSFRGYCYYDLGEYRSAVDSFLELARVMKEKNIAYELIAECYMKLDEYEPAVDFLQQALALVPDNANVCYQLATCYYELGNYDETENFLQRTVSLDDTDADAYCFLGEIRLQRKLPEEALPYFRKADELSGDDAEILSFLGDTLVLLKRYDEAVLQYEKALGVLPGDVKLIFKISIALYNAGRYEEASEHISGLEGLIGKLDERIDIPEADRRELLRTKKLLSGLRSVLGDGLDEVL